MSPKKRIVVKVGTGVFYDKTSDENGYVLKGGTMDAFVGEMYELNKIVELMIVSSGAIATAAYMYKLQIPQSSEERAVLAGIGQPLLMKEYAKRFEKYGQRIAQCLVTREDVDIERRCINKEIDQRIKNLRGVQESYFRRGIIAIYNENDAISFAEISLGDNDILAAMVSVATEASNLYIISHPVEGFGRGGGQSKKIARDICEKNKIQFSIINDCYEKDENDHYKSLILNLIRD